MSGMEHRDPGRFNRQLSIENLTETADGFGGYIKQYTVDGSVWAHICPRKALLNVAGELKQQEVSHRILMRFRNGIKPGSRLITGSRKFRVVRVSDPDETGRYLECEAMEE